MAAKQNHGDHMDCPACGSPGHFDEMGGNVAVFEDAVWINKFIGNGQWECYECWLK